MTPRQKLLISSLIFLSLIASLTLLILHIEKSKSKKTPPCFKFLLNDDTLYGCKSTPILLELSGALLVAGSIPVLLFLYKIRNWKFVKYENPFSFPLSLILSLTLTFVPFLVTPHTTFGLFCGAAFLAYFWALGTSLSSQTNTKLHSIFAVVNLTGAIDLLVLNRDHWRVVVAHSVVLVVSALLHLASLRILAMVGPTTTLVNELDNAEIGEGRLV